MAKYKIEIDREACIGDQACVNDAPETFEIDDENIAKVKNAAGDTPDTILTAAQNCPTDAIKLIDESGKQVWPEA
jgi:ferredoxin